MTSIVVRRYDGVHTYTTHIFSNHVTTVSVVLVSRISPIVFSISNILRKSGKFTQNTFTKGEGEAAGYLWRDEPIKVDIPEWLEIVNSSELDRFQGFREEKWHIDPSILEKGIVDERWNYYRIVKMEYDFLMKHGLPLPTTHWLDRIKMGFR